MICKLVLLFVFLCTCFSHIPKPIQLSIPESKIVSSIPKKIKDCATVIPKYLDTYIFDQEKPYFKDYQDSYYAITCKKGGWDCFRHYEILANGCIPFFYDLDDCPDNCMCFLPKDLIKKAMRLKGVIYNGYNITIDHGKFNKKQYFKILEELLQYTRKHLTCRAMGQYLLDSIGYTGDKPILFLSGQKSVDYIRCLTLIGLRQCCGNNIIDVHKIPHIYKSYPYNVNKLYGKGIGYTKILDDPKINRKNISKRIKRQEFEFIVYGSCHRGMPFLELVKKAYPEEKIIYICGEDFHECEFKNYPNFYLREFEES